MLLRCTPLHSISPTLVVAVAAASTQRVPAPKEPIPASVCPESSHSTSRQQHTERGHEGHHPTNTQPHTARHTTCCSASTTRHPIAGVARSTIAPLCSASSTLAAAVALPHTRLHRTAHTARQRYDVAPLSLRHPLNKASTSQCSYDAAQHTTRTSLTSSFHPSLTHCSLRCLHRLDRTTD